MTTKIDEIKSLIEKVEGSEIKSSDKMLEICINSEAFNSSIEILKNNSFKLLSISCVDRIEDKKFELLYILESSTTLVMIRVKIDRQNPKFVSLSEIFPPAIVFEKEIQLMFGVKFEERIHEPLLIVIFEKYPLRRDFDSRESVKSQLETKHPEEEGIK